MYSVKTFSHKTKISVPVLLIAGAIVFLSHTVSGCSMFYDGEELFFSVGCSQCHSYNGRGGRMAPDLSGITNIRSDSWIDSYIKNPRSMNPDARMPSFGHLSKAERRAIIEFLEG